jgi:hypothetical protein
MDAGVRRAWGAEEATPARHVPAHVRHQQLAARRTAELDRRMQAGDLRSLPESAPVASLLRGGDWSIVDGLLAGRLDPCPMPPSPLRPGTEGRPRTSHPYILHPQP